MSNAWRDGGLRGREKELAVLNAFLHAVLESRGQALVLSGEAGIGKTALLGRLAEEASACKVLRTTSVESEMEFPYAGLHQVCAPLLARLDSLPAPQRQALSTVFGLSAGEAVNPFMVGLSVLSLLSDAAAEGPVLCLVDDVQWLDRFSVRVLTFVARRLLAEPIGIVFALREPHELVELTGLPTASIGGLSPLDASALLEAELQGPLDERVRQRLVHETRGNPLALLELPRNMNVEELAGGFSLPDVRPIENRVEQSFVGRSLALPAETQKLLLVAAAEPLGDTALLFRACSLLGLDSAAAAPAEAAGLIDLGVQVRFCHPLVRSALYSAATVTDRREAHAALAAATAAGADPDRRAWHLAQAATGPDEGVAAELERSADRAKSRGGNAAAAAFMRRATELTPSPGRRAARALDAAAATFEAGAPDSAHVLLATAELGPLDDLQHARLARLRAQVEFARKRGSDAPLMLLEAAQRLESLDVALAREAYLDAFAAALFTGRLGPKNVLRAVAQAALAAPPAPQPARPIDDLLDGLATRFAQGSEAGATQLRSALQKFEAAATSIEGGTGSWLWLAWFVAGDLWDDKRWHGLAQRAMALTREVGALIVLPVSLESGAAALIHGGEFAAAAALLHESDSISAATGNALLRYSSLVLAAWRGHEAETLQLVEDRLADAHRNGEGRVIGLAAYVKAVLYNGLGRYDLAVAAASAGTEYDDLEITGFALVELVEAAVRAGDMATAASALEQLELRTKAVGTPWGRGIEARSRALLRAGAEAEALYAEAVESLERSRIPIHLARARLLFGEWLRRENRREDARAQLRPAYEAFCEFGAKAFAERAGRELLATGETVRPRNDASRDQLTPQELQIARLAATRLTNPEIASQLFLSHRTVEYHLHKVFGKLGIGSRKELEAALHGVK